MANNKTSFVGFYEEPEVVEILVKVAEARGMNISSFVRSVLREKLGELSYLPSATKKALGILPVKEASA
jgi:hypothetical protein